MREGMGGSSVRERRKSQRWCKNRERIKREAESGEKNDWDDCKLGLQQAKRRTGGHWDVEESWQSKNEVTCTYIYMSKKLEDIPPGSYWENSDFGGKAKEESWEWLCKDSGTNIRGLLEKEGLLLQKVLGMHKTDRKCWALSTKSEKSGWVVYLSEHILLSVIPEFTFSISH